MSKKNGKANDRDVKAGIDGSIEYRVMGFAEKISRHEVSVKGWDLACFFTKRDGDIHPCPAEKIWTSALKDMFRQGSLSVALLSRAVA